MRILMINSLYPPISIGGAERSVSLLAEALAAAGDEIHVATLHQQADEQCRIEGGVTVHRLDAGDFYRSIDVLIVPSLWPEPLPRTLIEAIAHSRSIIAARSGGIGEAAPFAPCIALYRADDPNALAEAMRVAIDCPGAWRPDGSHPPALPPVFSAAAAAAAVDSHRAIYRRVLDRQ